MTDAPGQASGPAGARTITVPEWLTVKSVAAGLVAVIGATASVISVVQFMGRDASGFDTLALSAVPVTDNVTEWGVEPDAVASFPTDNAACGPAQRAWLEDNGVELDRRWSVTMGNTASEGAQLALGSFVAEVTETSAVDQPLLMVVCDPRQGASLPTQFARLDTDGSPARYVRPVADGEAPTTEAPVSWNLAPGETGIVGLNLYGATTVSGSLAVSVTSAGETRSVPVAGSEFTLPALFMGGEIMLFTDADGLRCVQLLQSTMVECTVANAVAAAETSTG